MLKTDHLSNDNPNQIWFNKTNMLLDTYPPLKMINKGKLKVESKPWITLDLQKSIFVKNTLIPSFFTR